MIDYWNSISLLGELTQEDLINGLRLGVQAGTIVPLYSGSATQEYRDRPAPQRDRRFLAIADGPGSENSVWKACIRIRERR